jgi:Na+-transporting methylmalonyl-CoA/oxaloacetate decarboxylase gamma subunit
MDNLLAIALAVSGVGLLILFAALAFLYGLIYAMTALIKDPPGAQQEESVPIVETDERMARGARRAAVIGVALARAELESRPIGPLPAETSSRPWGQYHRRRLLNFNRRTRTGR